MTEKGRDALRKDEEQNHEAYVKMGEVSLRNSSTEGLCDCDDPTVIRTLAKGTPAEREFCECGGMLRPASDL